MSFIAGLGYFVSWGNYNDQTCFPLLDVVISELLTTAPAHIDKYRGPEREVIICATFFVYVRGIESLSPDPHGSLPLDLTGSLLDSHFQAFWLSSIPISAQGSAMWVVCLSIFKRFIIISCSFIYFFVYYLFIYLLIYLLKFVLLLFITIFVLVLYFS